MGRPIQGAYIPFCGPANKPIQVKTDLRDLGVRVSNSLNINIHIKKVIASASKLVGWGLRTFSGRARGVMLTILKSLVKPALH